MFKKEKETEKNRDLQLDGLLKDKIKEYIDEALKSYGFPIDNAAGGNNKTKVFPSREEKGSGDDVWITYGDNGWGDDFSSLAKQKLEFEKQLASLELEKEKLAFRAKFENEKLNSRLEEAEKQQKELEEKIIKLKNDNNEIKNINVILLDKNEKLDKLAQDSGRNIANLNERLKEKEQALSRQEEAYNTYVNKINALKVPDLVEAYLLFTSLKGRTRDNIRGIFETDTFLGFVSSSMQWEHIASIWEQAKRKIVNDDQEDVDVLRKLFLALFDIYNYGYNEAPYKLISPKIGSRYNSADSVIIGQKSDGIVKDVLLEGYIQIRNNTVNNALIQVE